MYTDARKMQNNPFVMFYCYHSVSLELHIQNKNATWNSNIQATTRKKCPRLLTALLSRSSLRSSPHLRSWYTLPSGDA